MNNDYLKDVLFELQNIYEKLKSNKDKRMIKKLIIKIREWLEKGVIRQMKLHELKIKHEYLIDVALGKKTFELRYNDRDYQVGDLIRFIDIGEDDTTTTKCQYEPNIDENTLYRITYVLKNVEKYGLDKDYCILAIKKLEIKEK